MGVEGNKTNSPTPAVEECVNKNNGMHLIIEPGYKLETLCECMKASCLAESTKFLETEKDIKKICKEFIKLVREKELNLDEMCSIFVAASLCYFINAVPENLEWRSQLLHKAFQSVDTLSPLHIHMATKRLWQALKTDDQNYVFNILALCQQLACASETGRAIAICLIWSILFEITEVEVEMYCFHPFSHLLNTLNEVDCQLLAEEDKHSSFYVLVRCIGYIINAVVLASNDDFEKAGYRNYFVFKKHDLEQLKTYAESLLQCLKFKVSADSNYELKMTIKEYIEFNIVSVLQEKIIEMQN